MSAYMALTVAVVVAVLTAVLRGSAKGTAQEGDDVDVRKALAEVLRSAPPGQSGGFVIFHGKGGSGCVQYALQPEGLELYTSDVERLPLFEKYLKANGYVRLTPRSLGGDMSQLVAMLKGQYMVLYDGLYCQLGRDVEEVRAVTLGLMASVFAVAREEDFRITIEPEG